MRTIEFSSFLGEGPAQPVLLRLGVTSLGSSRTFVCCWEWHSFVGQSGMCVELLDDDGSMLPLWRQLFLPARAGFTCNHFHYRNVRQVLSARSDVGKATQGQGGTAPPSAPQRCASLPPIALFPGLLVDPIRDVLYFQAFCPRVMSSGGQGGGGASRV